MYTVYIGMRWFPIACVYYKEIGIILSVCGVLRSILRNRFGPNYASIILE